MSQAVPKWISDAARELPERVADRGPTTGRIYTADGKPLGEKPFTSGKNVAPTGDLRPVPELRGRGWPWTITDHVEPAVAARMREPDAPRDVRLVLNKQPCTRGKYACHRILPHLLPAGSRLTVYVKDTSRPEGVREHDTYQGSGKAIKP